MRGSDFLKLVVILYISSSFNKVRATMKEEEYV
jgi:hypothetical protein